MSSELLTGPVNEYGMMWFEIMTFRGPIFSPILMVKVYSAKLALRVSLKKEEWPRPDSAASTLKIDAICLTSASYFMSFTCFFAKNPLALLRIGAAAPFSLYACFRLLFISAEIPALALKGFGMSPWSPSVGFPDSIGLFNVKRSTLRASVVTFFAEVGALSIEPNLTSPDD